MTTPSTYISDTFDYEKPVSRLVQKLDSFGANIPEALLRKSSPNEASDLSNILFDAIGERGWTFGQRLQEEPNGRTWVNLILGSSLQAKRLEARFAEDVICCENMETALSLVFDLYKDDPLLPSVEISARKKDLIVNAGDDLTAVIAPIKFEVVAPENRKRVENSLKHIMLYDNVSFGGKLKKLQGIEPSLLQSRSISGSTVSEPMVMTTSSLVHRIKKEVTPLISSFEGELKLGKWQEVTAAFFGAKSWNHFVKYKDKEFVSENVFRLNPAYQGKMQMPGTDIVYFKHWAEVVWEFCKRVKDTPSVDQVFPNSVSLQAYVGSELQFIAYEATTFFEREASVESLKKAREIIPTIS